MNIQEIYDQLNNCLEKLKDKDIDDEAKLDLELLVIQLKRQIRMAVFDPLKNLDNVTVADLSQLSDLISQVQEEIANEKNRAALVQKVIVLAKIGLKAAGLPIPS